MERTAVAIVGGGPVGLLLAIQLRSAGIACRVLERRLAPSPHSRAIGIHPPSLELLDRLGLASPLVERGRRVTRGHAFVAAARVGSLSFARCPPPFRFVLSLPQDETERVLEARLRALDGAVLQRGVEVLGVEADARGRRAEIVMARGDGPRAHLQAELVVGCDGKASVVRRSAGIPFDGATYPDSFVMGDFSDTTDFGDDAALFLHREGVVESFPLPGRRRRWVARVDRPVEGDLRRILGETVAARSGHDLRPAECFMTSRFEPQRLLARTLVLGRIVLAGDAAHVVSPIGGQGMNLGWLNAALLARAAIDLLAGGDADALVSAYGRPARRRALWVAQRAGFNTLMARSTLRPRLRGALVHLLLWPPFAEAMARLFTMRGLGRA